MTDHVDLTNAELHEPKGMLPLTGGAPDVGKVIVSKGDGTSEARKLDVSELEGEFKGLRTIHINKASDFPAAVAGVITLDDRVQYLIGDNISVGTDRFAVAPFTVIKGIDEDNGRIEYTGTGDMFTATDVTWLMEDLTITADNGRAFNHTETGGEFFRARNISVDADVLGSFSSTGDGVFLIENLIASSVTKGFTFAGNWNIFQMSIASDVQINGEFLDFAASTWNSIGLDSASVFLVTSGSTFIKGLANSGNINSGGLARVNNCVINNLGGGTILDTVTPDDVRWRFMGNQGIRDTRPDALMSMDANATETVIAVATTPVLIAGTWVEAAVSQFTTDAAGRMTFVGEVDARVPIDLIVSAQMASGSATDLSVCMYVNGVVVPETSMPINDVTTTKPDKGVSMWQYTFTNGDYVEFFIANDGGTANIIVTDAIARIN